MRLRELVDALAEIQLYRGDSIEVLSEEGADVVSVEYNDEDEPCVLILFEEER